MANREWHGWRVFHDYGNPWVKRPARCQVGHAGATRAISLDWQPQPADCAALSAKAGTGVRPPFEVRHFAGGRWISAGSFHAGDGTPAAKALPALIAAARGNQQTLRDAPRLVLDLRGNTGGSSDWGAQLARLLWGDAAVDRIGAALDQRVGG